MHRAIFRDAGARSLLALACAGALALTACDDDPTGVPRTVTYEVTVENLTEGQPLSPGVLVTHQASTFFWRTGEASSEGVRSIAEDGVPDPAVQELDGASGVSDVVATDAPIHRIGGPGATSATYQVSASGDADRLSVALMLICTNDGFVGLDAAPLPSGQEPVTYDAVAYDAGTEQNTELFADLPDPCQVAGPVAAPADGNRDDQVSADGGDVRLHPGISGGADLDPAAHGWQGAAARITVQRTP